MIVKLGEQYAKWDREGKKMYIDQLEAIEDRWDIFIKRFELMGVNLRIPEPWPLTLGPNSFGRYSSLIAILIRALGGRTGAKPNVHQAGRRLPCKASGALLSEACAHPFKDLPLTCTELYNLHVDGAGHSG